MFINSNFSFAFVAVAPVLVATTSCASQTEPQESDATYAADQVNANVHVSDTTGSSGSQGHPEQICCTNVPGYGSVVYWQSWAGYGYVTTDTYAHQGGSCPYVNNTCTSTGN